jgi:hypothetical protein
MLRRKKALEKFATLWYNRKKGLNTIPTLGIRSPVRLRPSHRKTTTVKKLKVVLFAAMVVLAILILFLLVILWGRNK